MASWNYCGMEWKICEENYEINQEKIWLNNAGITPIGKLQKQAIHSYMEEYSKHGIFAPNYSYPKIKESILGHLGNLMKVPTKNLALIHNTSEGFNFLSLGLTLKAGDRIILLENEYPSNYYPWEHWEEKSVSFEIIPMQKKPEDYLNSVESILRKKTKGRSVLSLSPVHWCTGIPLPMKEISELCRSYGSSPSDGIFLAIDGAQGLGNVEVLPEDWGADFLAASAWKWLLGPLGLGVLYVSDRGLAELKPVFKGTQSVPNESQYLPYKTEWKQTADRYEYSTPAFMDWVYFEKSLTMLNEIGFSRVRDRIHFLANYAYEKCREIGISTSWDGMDVTTHSPKSGILSLVLDSADEKKDYLFREKIIVASRMEMVRISPHIYNSTEQLDEVFSFLSQSF